MIADGDRSVGARALSRALSEWGEYRLYITIWVQPNTFAYELFIVHAEADGPLVHRDLLPALGIALDRVLLSSKLELGRSIVSEIERGILESRLTIAVLTPHFMAERWTVLGEQIAGHANGAEGRLVPLWLLHCDLPPRLDFLEKLDFRDRTRWASESQRLRDRLGRPPREEADPPCPYPGMRPYSAETAAYFHGRDAEVERIVGRLRMGEREIYVIGPSGSGKSSLVVAGVLPRLAQAAGLTPLVVRIVRPGERPAERLAEALEGDLGAPAQAVRALLARHAGARSMLIVIDQLEELFTQAANDERRRFLAALGGLRAEPTCLLLTASRDNTARVWNSATGEPMTLLLEHEASVNAAAFARGRSRVVTASADKTARVWDVATEGFCPRRFGHRHAVYTAEFSPDGTRIVTASADATAQVWSAGTTTPVTPPLRHQAGVNSASFNSAGTHVVTASSDRTACVWSAVTGERSAPPLVHTDIVNSAVFSCDGARIATASSDGTARIWDAVTGAPITDPLEHDAVVTAIALCPNLSCVVTASDDKGWIWDLETGERRMQLVAHQDVVHCVVISPDGTRVATGSWDSTARIWDIASGELVAQPLAHHDEVLGVAFSPDGTRVVVASRDKTARIWDAATGQPVTPPLLHDDEVLSAAFSPDGSRVVTTSRDRTARIWDTATGKPVALALPHAGTVYSAVFNREGSQLVTASDDELARIWDVPFDARTLAEWRAIVDQRSSHCLVNGVLVSRALLAAQISAVPARPRRRSRGDPGFAPQDV